MVLLQIGASAFKICGSVPAASASALMVEGLFPGKRHRWHQDARLIAWTTGHVVVDTLAFAFLFIRAIAI